MFSLVGLIVIVIILSSCGGLKIVDHKSEKAFVAFWKEDHFKEAWFYKFSELKELEGLKLNPPENIKNDFESILQIYSSEDYEIILVNPRNILKDKANKNGFINYIKEQKICIDDHSWIVLLPENLWIPTELNPYCTVVYGEDEIDIVLYWCSDSIKPIIEIVTDHPACIPHYLFVWDHTKNAYRAVGEKCE